MSDDISKGVIAALNAEKKIGSLRAAPPPKLLRLTRKPNKPDTHILDTVASLGKAIRQSRKSKGLTQQNFADLAGVGRRFVSELEQGKPTLEIEKVIKVAAAAGIQLMFKQTDTAK